jgi:hypothetical protein
MEHIYDSEDSEELYRRHKTVRPDPLISLAGIASIYELTRANIVKDIIYYIEEFEDIANALGGACRGGHIDLAMFITKKYPCNLDRGLMEACQGGHVVLARLIVMLMHAQGIIDLNWGLVGACYGGQRELALLMIDIMKCSGCPVNFTWGSKAARLYGHQELIELMIQKHAEKH